jgi:uncharacterized protein YkwD
MNAARRLVSAAASILVGAAVFAGPLVGTANAATSDTYERDVITFVNKERTSRGKVAVKQAACLDAFAERQAAKMASQRRIFHQSMSTVLLTCDLQLVSENVAAGYAGGKLVTQGWMRSPGHRMNILESRNRLTGVGAVKGSDGRWYVAQVFGKAF